MQNMNECMFFWLYILRWISVKKQQSNGKDGFQTQKPADFKAPEVG